MSGPHSPGPWRWKAMHGCTELHSATGDIFCVQDDHNGFWDPAEPDAALIAAAPEMAALLLRMSKALGRLVEVYIDVKDGAPVRDPLAVTEVSDAQAEYRALLARLPPEPKGT